LFLAILDEGQRELVTYLQHQTAKAETGTGKVRNWVVGIMSQAAVPGAASATRGVMMNSHELQASTPKSATGSISFSWSPLSQPSDWQRRKAPSGPRIR